MDGVFQDGTSGLSGKRRPSYLTHVLKWTQVIEQPGNHVMIDKHYVLNTHSAICFSAIDKAKCQDHKFKEIVCKQQSIFGQQIFSHLGLRLRYALGLKDRVGF